MKCLTTLCCLLAACFLTANVGCNSPTQSTTADKSTPNATSTAATQPVVIDGVGTEPAQAVAVFLDSLRRGDETAANAVLTARAHAELQKTNYQIQPIGTPEGKYTIGRVGFPYDDKSVALVECQWSEPANGNEPPIVMDIVCEVHHEVQGWRIAGLGVKLDGTEDTLVLDFEDAASLQATIEGVSQPSNTAQVNTLQTSAMQGSSFGDNALPTMQLPNNQPANYEQPNAPATQLAYPPINNAPVQR